MNVQQNNIFKPGLYSINKVKKKEEKVRERKIKADNAE
jgi:hypothetical protein